MTYYQKVRDINYVGWVKLCLFLPKPDVLLKVVLSNTQQQIVPNATKTTTRLCPCKNETGLYMKGNIHESFEVAIHHKYICKVYYIYTNILLVFAISLMSSCTAVRLICHAGCLSC